MRQIRLSQDCLATYTYDYLSRRVGRHVAGQSTESWVYDGWNPIAEYSGNSLRKTYTWGQDLSGSQQGAGGVGGLLSVKDLSASQPASFSVLYDGNGNVTEYLDNTGTIAAHFEYDAFGKTVVKTGPKANDFEHQFSTKPLDATSGLHYYGYRYYDATNGRWINRDPIEENGGVNIYEMVTNDPVDLIDILGLDYLVFVPDCENCPPKVGKNHRDPSGSLQPGKLIVCGDNKSPKMEFTSNTGGYKTDDSKVEGPNTQIQAGVYKVGNRGILNHPNATVGNHNFFYPLVPLPGNSTPQTGLGIHPDGGFPGTHGCVGCRENEETLQKLDEYLKKQSRPLTLTVLPNEKCKTKNPCEDAKSK